MGWKADAKSIKQTKYGHYCKKCRELGIKEVPYSKFEINMLDQVKKFTKVCILKRNVISLSYENRYSP